MSASDSAAQRQGREAGVRGDTKTVANCVAAVCGLTVAVGTFLPFVDIGFASRSFINSVRYGEGGAVLAAGALCLVLGLINVFVRKNWELFYVIVGILSAIEVLWVLHRLKEVGLTSDFVGAASYLILLGALGLFISGIVGMAASGIGRPPADT